MTFFTGHSFFRHRRSIFCLSALALRPDAVRSKVWVHQGGHGLRTPAAFCGVVIFRSFCPYRTRPKSVRKHDPTLRSGSAHPKLPGFSSVVAVDRSRGAIRLVLMQPPPRVANLRRVTGRGDDCIEPAAPSRMTSYRHFLCNNARPHSVVGDHSLGGEHD